MNTKYMNLEQMKQELKRLWKKIDKEEFNVRQLALFRRADKLRSRIQYLEQLKEESL